MGIYAVPADVNDGNKKKNIHNKKSDLMAALPVFISDCRLNAEYRCPPQHLDSYLKYVFIFQMQGSYEKNTGSGIEVWVN